MHEIKTVIVELEYPMDSDSFVDYSDEYYGIGEELVRCKDCKHYFEDAFREDEWVICRRTNLYTDGDKYCAWAERKTE